MPVATEQREACWVNCAKCGHEFAPAYLPMDAGVWARIMRSARCPMCGAGAKSLKMGKVPKSTGDGDWRGWFLNGDTGVSSETIWSVMTGETVRNHDIPHDPDDFGRCYRLLKVMPSWRARLPEVAAKFKRWKRFVEAWDELTALYEQEVPNHIGSAPKLYARMQELAGR